MGTGRTATHPEVPTIPPNPTIRKGLTADPCLFEAANPAEEHEKIGTIRAKKG